MMYEALLAHLRECAKLDLSNNTYSEAAAAIKSLMVDKKEAVNELCLKCGAYKQRHSGACDGCRWRGA